MKITTKESRIIVGMMLRSCWHDFVTTLYIIIISIQFPDNAKPVSRRTRSRCQYFSSKPMSERIPDNVKPMSGRTRSRCQYNAKPMSRYCEADVKANAKQMSRRMRSRCQGDREADAEKAFTRAHAEWKYTRTQRVP